MSFNAKHHNITDNRTYNTHLKKSINEAISGKVWLQHFAKIYISLLTKASLLK